MVVESISWLSSVKLDLIILPFIQGLKTLVNIYSIPPDTQSHTGRRLSTGLALVESLAECLGDFPLFVDSLLQSVHNLDQGHQRGDEDLDGSRLNELSNDPSSPRLPGQS